jgi:hypothetical protein
MTGFRMEGSTKPAEGRGRSNMSAVVGSARLQGKVKAVPRRAPGPCCAAGNPQGALEPTRRDCGRFRVSGWFSASAKARPSCPTRTHGAVALVHRSGHPFASHAEKLASNFLIGCQASKPHPFARVVTHSSSVTMAALPAGGSAIGISAPSA